MCQIDQSVIWNTFLIAKLSPKFALQINSWLIHHDTAFGFLGFYPIQCTVYAQKCTVAVQKCIEIEFLVIQHKIFFTITRASLSGPETIRRD